MVGKRKSQIYQHTKERAETNDQVVHLPESAVINMNAFHKSFQIHEAITEEQ